MVDSPSGRVPAKAPRWDLADTEGYGGGNCVSWCSWMFSGSVDIYRRKKYVGGRPRGPRDRRARPRGGAPPTLVTASLVPWSRVQVSWITFGEKITFPKILFRLDSV